MPKVVGEVDLTGARNVTAVLTGRESFHDCLAGVQRETELP